MSATGMFPPEQPVSSYTTADLPIAPPGNLEAATLARMARADFEAAWDALVERRPADPDFGGGNFMFSLMAMVYLELICRTVAADASGMVMRHFSERLAEIEPRYLTKLPGVVAVPTGVKLPTRPGVPVDRTLLAMLFDLIRNGQAHLYQQISVALAAEDRETDLLTIALGGTTGRPTIAETRAALTRPADHLLLERTPKQHLRLTVLPDVLFTDFDVAARRSSVFSLGLVPSYFQRRRRKTKRGTVYDFRSAELEAALCGLAEQLPNS